MDSTRELRAMIMVSFPCPPLPMMSDTDGSVQNSHDFLAYLIDVAGRRGMHAEDSERCRKQEKLLVDFERVIGLCQDEASTWETMTCFTRDYMMTYHVVTHAIRFLPFSAVNPKLKRAVCSWLASQYILKDDPYCQGCFFEHLEPWPLYRECVKNTAFSFISLGDGSPASHGNTGELGSLQETEAIEDKE